jgi:hypothetical protein
MKSEYLTCPWNTFIGDWYKNGFTSEKSPTLSPFATLATSRRRVSWNEKPEYAGQVRELMELLPWNRLDRPAVAGSFISR